MPERHYNIPVFIPEFGCPFQCVFCNQRKISGHQGIPSTVEVQRIVELHLATINPLQSHVEIAFFGGNFTGLQASDQMAYLEAASKYVHRGLVQSIRLSTRPDYINQETIDLLKQYPVKTIELGAQSLDDEVLKAAGRGHTAKQIEVASELIQQANFELVLQMMTGLPSDTPDKSLNTASRIIGLGASATRIYPCLVIEGTRLAELYKAGKYRPQTLEEAVQLIAKLIVEFDKAQVTILRIGLHASEELAKPESLLAGPYHPALREMAESLIWQSLFEKGLNFDKSGEIRIVTSPGQTAKAAGFKGQNRAWLERRFKHVSFAADPSLLKRDFNVHYC
jgi:histone acetyltransferase (RNA polymerase elongator complex component)